MDPLMLRSSPGTQPPDVFAGVLASLSPAAALFVSKTLSSRLAERLKEPKRLVTDLTLLQEDWIPDALELLEAEDDVR